MSFADSDIGYRTGETLQRVGLQLMGLNQPSERLTDFHQTSQTLLFGQTVGEDVPHPVVNEFG